MKFKVSENMIDSAIYWIEAQTIELIIFYCFNFWNQRAMCDDVKGRLLEGIDWHPDTKIGQISNGIMYFFRAIFIIQSFLPFFTIPIFRYVTEWLRKPSDNELKLRKVMKKVRKGEEVKKEDLDDIELSKDSEKGDQDQAEV